MKKWFSLALVLAMGCTILGDLAPTFAEQDVIESVAVEAETAAVDGETSLVLEEEVPVLEDEIDLDGDVPDDGPMEMPGDDQIPGAEESADEAGLWYARTKVSLTLEIDATVSRTIPADTILLVTGDIGDGLVRVACAGLAGAVDASALKKLTDEEYQSFMDALTELEEVALYDGNLDYPLPPAPEEVQSDTPADQSDEDDNTDDEQPGGGEGEDPEQSGEGENIDPGQPVVDDEPDAEQPADGEDAASEQPGEGENPDGEQPAEGENIDSEQSVDGENTDPEQPADGENTDGVQPAEGENAEPGQPADGEKPDADEQSGEEKDEGEKTEEQKTEEKKAEEGEEKSPEAADAEVTAESEEADAAQKDEDAAEADDKALQAAGIPAAVKFNLGSVVMGVKEKYAGLTANVVDANGDAVPGKTVTWRSGNAKVVSVDAAGKLTARKRGIAYIYAACEGLPEASIQVMVKKAPSKVKLDAKAISLSVGMLRQLLPTVNSGAASAGFTFSSSNPAVASVDAGGRVTANAPGKATITVRSFNKKKAKCAITVTPAPARIAPSSDKLLVAVGLTKTNPIRGYDANNAVVSCDCTYAIDASSANPGCVKVNGSGAVTGLSLGSAVIRVKSYNNLETTFAVDVVPAPSDMNLSASSVVIGVKEKYNAAGMVSLVAPQGQSGCSTQLTWTSSRPKVVKVTADGELKGVKRGSATVTVATHNGIKKSLTVVVRKAPSKVSVTPKALSLSVGMSGRLTPKVNRGAGSGAFTYASSNPNIAQVDARGTVTGKAAGKATITIKTFNNKKAKCTVTVTGEPASVATGSATCQVGVGMTANLSVVARDAAGNATPANYAFRSADPGIASVNGAGTIAGVRLGTTTVTVTTHNGKTTTCNVEVLPAPSAIKLNASAITIGVKEKFAGMTYTLVPPSGQSKCAAGVTWKTSNKKVARVTADGVIQGVKKGSATITVTTGNNLVASVKVKVKAAPKKVTVTPKSVSLLEGQKQQLTVKVNKGAASGGFTYSSSNTGVATVDNNGLVTGISTGTATITVKSFNGKKGTCKVTVQGLPKQVTITDSLKLAVGMTGTVKATALDGGGKACNATYTFTAVDGTGSVTVDSTGKVTAVRAGTAQIRVSTHNGVKTHRDASGNDVETVCNITIVEAPAGIRMEPKVSLEVGQVFTLNPVMFLPDGSDTSVGTYNLTVSGSSVKLNGNVITAVDSGTSTITATTYNGKTAACTVTVTRRYRLFAAYSYFNVIEKGSLTFPKNNATSFQKVFKASSIGGLKYEALGLLGNPSKSDILNGIANAFSGGRDSDVNVVYLCSHGFNYVDVPTSSKSTHYGLQLPGYEDYTSESKYYISAEEIFNAIVGIKGQVILVLDSCYSGEFITNMKSNLDKQGGRISVMTAASNTRACYYNVEDTNSACDFFTYYMLMGMGYDMKDSHQFSGSMPADTNKDGRLTFNEIFNYAKSGVTANMNGFKNKSWFHGDPAQTPRVYKGSNGDLVLYQYAG